MDESGTLGSDSQYYIISAVVSYKSRDIEKHYYEAVNEARINKFHFKNDKDEVREIFIKYISKMDIDIYCLIIDKDGRNYLAIHDKNFAEKWKTFVEELIGSIEFKGKSQDIKEIFYDRISIPKREISSFERDLSKITNNVRFKIKGDLPGIRVADYVSSSIRLYYEKKNDRYYSKIKNKVVKEIILR